MVPRSQFFFAFFLLKLRLVCLYFAISVLFRIFFYFVVVAYRLADIYSVLQRIGRSTTIAT